jgi:hypothetical protein
MKAMFCWTVLGLAALISAAATPSVAQQAPKDLKATVVSPTKVRLTWTRGTNATTHRIYRGVPGSPPHPIDWVPTPGAAYTDASAPAGTELVYQVMGKYPSGPNAYSVKIRVTTPAATNTAAGAPSSGPPAAGGPPAKTPAAIPSSPVLSAVPVLRTATLAPVDVALAPAPAAGPAPAPAAAPATPVSGRYRVVANGFSVVHESFDDFLSRDGKYDEVYGGFIMFHYDRQTGNLLDRDLRRTKVLGDVNNFPDRLRAGTASGTGGLRAGDSYPDAGHARFRGQDGAQPNDQTFPFKVWEGTLTDGRDAAIIMPSIWEQDNDASPYDLWHQSEVTSASQIWFDAAVQQAVKQTALGVIAPPGSITPNITPTFGAEAAAASGFFAAMGQPWVGALFAGSRDRPIGMSSSGVLPTLPRRAIVLTREIVEAALNGSRVLPNPAALAPPEMFLLAYLDVPVGVIPVLLRDGPGANLQATYVMYLQVERM